MPSKVSQTSALHRMALSRMAPFVTLDPARHEPLLGRHVASEFFQPACVWFEHCPLCRAHTHLYLCLFQTSRSRHTKKDLINAPDASFAALFAFTLVRIIDCFFTSSFTGPPIKVCELIRLQKCCHCAYVQNRIAPVSYTHLTLPTILLV